MGQFEDCEAEIEALEPKMQCSIVVNLNLPSLCIIATSRMPPALSPPLTTGAHTEADGAAKELITGAFNAKKATQWIVHLKSFLPSAANFIKCASKVT